MALLTSYRHLTTEQLILRPLELTDAPAIFQYTSDPHVARFTHWDAHTNLDETIRYIQRIKQLTYTQVWGIALQNSKTLIGECSITCHENGTAELYYALAYPHWGNGYTTQALTTLLNVIEEVNTIDHLEAWIIKENIASCRVAEKVGLQLTHVIDQAWILDKSAHDIAVYSK